MYSHTSIGPDHLSTGESKINQQQCICQRLAVINGEPDLDYLRTDGGDEWVSTRATVLVNGVLDLWTPKAIVLISGQIPARPDKHGAIGSRCAKKG